MLYDNDNMFNYEPIKMTPSFRFGAATPWGGTGLRAFGKPIPDERTGESLIAVGTMDHNLCDLLALFHVIVHAILGQRKTGPDHAGNLGHERYLPFHEFS